MRNSKIWNNMVYFIPMVYFASIKDPILASKYRFKILLYTVYPKSLVDPWKRWWLSWKGRWKEKMKRPSAPPLILHYVKIWPFQYYYSLCVLRPTFEGLSRSLYQGFGWLGKTSRMHRSPSPLFFLMPLSSLLRTNRTPKTNRLSYVTVYWTKRDL